jgi:5-methylcytosine-specific restriction endonuclease McrA
MDGMKVYKNRQEAIEAKARGEKGVKYHGRLCSCGCGVRLFPNGNCIDCNREKVKNWCSNRYKTCEKYSTQKLQSNKGWREKNPDRANAIAAKRRSAKQNNPLPTGWEESKRENREAFYKEAVRLKEETGIEHHVDHIIPISRGGVDHELNYQILTAEQNLQKSNKMPDVTFEELAEIPPLPEFRLYKY